MRSECLGSLRNRRGAFLFSAIAVGVLITASVPREAVARLDPLRIVTSQIVRPNILFVIDTSGSMSWMPSDDTNVGGDCYQGQDCVNANSNMCSDGTTCKPANTCVDGTTACTPGSMSYCTDGSTCVNGAVGTARRARTSARLA
jgi:hypothetical protein